MLDRWTDLFFWPALIGAWVAAVVAAVGLAGEPLNHVVPPVTAVLGALAIVMFILAVLDGPTRRAVDDFNLKSKARWREMTWWERLFSDEYGDRRLLIVNRLVGLEVAIFVIIRAQDLALLGFVGFALSTLMLMLMMKRLSREG